MATLIPVFITAVNGNTMKLPMAFAGVQPAYNAMDEIMNNFSWDNNKTEDENHAALTPFAQSIGIPAADPNSGLTENIVISGCTALTEYINSIDSVSDFFAGNDLPRPVVLFDNETFNDMLDYWEDLHTNQQITGTTAGHVLYSLLQYYYIGFNVPNSFLEDVEETFGEYMQVSGNSYTLEGFVLSSSAVTVSGGLDAQNAENIENLDIDVLTSQGSQRHHIGVGFGHSLEGNVVAVPSDWDAVL